jgi:hypothetical protein
MPNTWGAYVPSGTKLPFRASDPLSYNGQSRTAGPDPTKDSIQNTVRALMGENIRMTEMMTAGNLAAAEGYPLSTQSLQHAINGRATVIQNDLAGHLGAEFNPIKAILATRCHHEQKIIVRSKYVIGAGVQILAERTNARTPAIKEDEREYLLIRIGGAVQQNLNEWLRPEIAAANFQMLYEAERKCMQRCLENMGYRALMEFGSQLIPGMQAANPATRNMTPRERLLDAEQIFVREIFGALAKQNNPVQQLLCKAQEAQLYTPSAAVDDWSVLLMARNAITMERFTKAEHMNYNLAGHGLAAYDGMSMKIPHAIHDPRFNVQILQYTPEANTKYTGEKYPDVEESHLAQEVPIATYHIVHSKMSSIRVSDWKKVDWAQFSVNKLKQLAFAISQQNGSYFPPGTDADTLTALEDGGYTFGDGGGDGIIEMRGTAAEDEAGTMRIFVKARDDLQSEVHELGVVYANLAVTVPAGDDAGNGRIRELADHIKKQEAVIRGFEENIALSLNNEPVDGDEIKRYMHTYDVLRGGLSAETNTVMTAYEAVKSAGTTAESDSRLAELKAQYNALLHRLTVRNTIIAEYNRSVIANVHSASETRRSDGGSGPKQPDLRRGGDGDGVPENPEGGGGPPRAVPDDVFDLVLIRPNMVMYTSSAILAAPGAMTGEMVYAYPFAAITSNEDTESLYMKIVCYQGAYLRDVKRVCILPSVHINGVLGGHGSKLATTTDFDVDEHDLIPVFMKRPDNDDAPFNGVIDLTSREVRETSAAELNHMLYKIPDDVAALNADPTRTSLGINHTINGSTPLFIYPGATHGCTTAGKWDKYQTNSGHLGWMDDPFCDRVRGVHLYSPNPNPNVVMT